MTCWSFRILKMNIDTQTVIYIVDLLGTGSFAFSGALRSIDKRPDFVGMTILASATAIGGAVMRDVILNRPEGVVVLRDWGYPLVILISSLITFLFPNSVYRREKLFKYFDAVGLGVFSAITASVAWRLGINPLSLILLSAITGCAGGVARDLIIQKPTLVLSNELYVTPVMIGAGVLMVLEWLGVDHLNAFLACMLVTTFARIAAIVWDLRLPRIVRAS